MRKFGLVSLFVLAFMLQGVTVQARTEVDTETPIEIQIACNKYGQQYGVCPELIEAIMYYESRYKADAQNGTCKGLMQINEPCHRERMKKLGVTDIFDEEGNILVATDYLAELFEEYEDAGIVLAVYHGEKNAIKNASNGILSNYSKKILEKSEELERIHGK